MNIAIITHLEFRFFLHVPSAYDFCLMIVCNCFFLLAREFIIKAWIFMEGYFAPWFAHRCEAFHLRTSRIILILITLILNLAIVYAADDLSIKWIQATAAASFPSRVSHSSLVYGNKIWVIGGNTTKGTLNDVWWSSDGISWNQATSGAAFARRREHASIVFKDKMWVIGGSSTDDGSTCHNDVWWSTDGATLTLATANAAFPAREHLGCVVFDGKIWVIGGIAYYGGAYHLYNDVWYSSDGVTWNQATPNAAFSKRYALTSVVHNNRMWVIGGVSSPDGKADHNDVWWSTDGATWNLATANAAFPARGSQADVVFANKIWISGGWLGEQYANDVWWSSDGVTWNNANIHSPFPARCAHSAVIHNQKIWIMGGEYDRGKNLNDVWSANFIPDQIIGHLTLSYTISYPSIAPEINPVAYVYQWSSDKGESVVHGPTTATSDILTEWQLVHTGDTWTVTVRPSDDTQNGPVATGIVKIVDSSSGVVQWMLYH